MLPSSRIVTLTAAACSAAVASSALAGIRYVRAGQDLPTNQQDGLSWETAFSTIQPAINAAVSGDEVRVGFGTYRPTEGSDRTVSIVLKQGVRVRGGYKGTGSTPDDRNVGLFQTTLTGDIGDGSTDDDNSFHVVRVNGGTAATVLDGFVIRDGNANGSGNDGIGAGLFVSSGSPAIVRCTFADNHAQKGGAIGRISGFSASSPMFLHGCLFCDNTAGQGAAIFGQLAPIQLMNSTVADNAGASAIDLSTISVASIFSSSILYRNTGGATAELSQFRTTSAPLTVARCCIEGWDNVAPASATSFGNDPMFFFGPEDVVTIRSRHRLRGDSPCLDQGECTPTDIADTDGDGNVTEPLARTLDEDERSIDDQFFSEGGTLNNPTTDMGVHEKIRPRTILVNHAATGANTGRTWVDAYTDLQSAIAELSDPRSGGVGQVWIAQGTYKPTSGTDVDATFLLSPGTHLLGGFVGNETTIAARDWVNHRTILSGELGTPGAAGNSRHVVTMGPGFSFVDGCVIRDGNAPAIVGGGGILVNSGAFAKIAHCVITGNTGVGPGSALRVQGGAGAILELAYSAIVGNSATLGGSAGVVVDGIQFFTIERSLIAGNTSQTGSASGLRVQGVPNPDFASVRNTVIADNAIAGVHSMSAQIATDGNGVLVDHCAIESFSPTLPGATLVNCFAIGPDGGLNDARGGDGAYGTIDDDYLPAVCGPLVDAGSQIILVSEPSNADLNEDGLGNFALNDYLDQFVLVDLPVANVATGADIGPIERQTASFANPDFGGDGFVSGADLAELLGAWGEVGSEFDLNGDCVIDAADLAVMLGAWG